MKLITYNVNGIRSAENKGFLSWLKAADPHVLCLQEVKADVHQIQIQPYTDLGYQIIWHAAQKKGYSGVAVFSKIKPHTIQLGCHNETYDKEGRMIEVDFSDFTLINVYFPSGTMGEQRQQFKYKWMDFFYEYIRQKLITKPKLVIGGDINICHKPIDIHNPIANKNSSGFLPEERAWLDRFLELGFIDAFRYFNHQPGQYTWWSFRANARSRNLGWRIDYFFASLALKKHLKSCTILAEARHSDHCPVALELS